MTLRRATGLALLATALATPAKAQDHALDQGSLQLGGSASVTSEGGGGADERATQIALNPHVHYFVARRVSLGADVILGYTSYSSTSMKRIGVGPSLTLYFRDQPAVVHPYVSGRVVFIRATASGPISDSSASARALGGAAGVLALVAPNVGITSELFYRTQRQSSGGTEVDSNVIGLSVGVAAFVF